MSGEQHASALPSGDRAIPIAHQQSQLTALLSFFDSDAAGFTLCEIGSDTCLIGLPRQGVSALVVLRGTLYLDDGRAAHASAGKLVLLPPQTRLRMASSTGDALREVDGAAALVSRGEWIVADARREGSTRLLVAAARITGTTGFAIDAPIVTSVSRATGGRRALAMLRDEIDRRAPGGAALSAVLMNACIMLGLRSAVDQSETIEPRVASPAIERAAAMIAVRPAQPHDINSLAAAVGMSRATFARQFLNAMQMTPMQYVLRARLGEAAAILRSTDLPIKAVANAAGFASRSHFSRAFSAAYGCDPTAFRDELRKG